MAPEKEDRIFKGIRFTHLSIIISMGLLFVGLIGVGGKIISSTTEILVQLRINTACTAQTTQDIKEVKETVKSNYADLSRRIDNVKDGKYNFFLSKR